MLMLSIEVSYMSDIVEGSLNRVEAPIYYIAVVHF